jgi:hypothetical protein
MQQSRPAHPTAKHPVCNMRCICQCCCCQCSHPSRYMKCPPERTCDRVSDPRSGHHPHPGSHECSPPHDYFEELLRSIAYEEAALARLVNQEALKTQRVAERIAGPFTPDEVISFQRSLADILYNIKKKEELLIKKLRLVLAAQRSNQATDD